MRAAFVLLFVLSTLASNAAPPLRVVTIAGVPGAFGLRDGEPTVALFDRPTWLEYDERGRIYVIDRQNNAIRAISSLGVHTLHVFTSFPARDEITFDFGPPFGGGIAIEPRTAGCGGIGYAAAMIVSSTGRHQVSMVVDEGWPYNAWAGLRDDIPTKVGLAGQPGYRDGTGATFYDSVPALLTEPGDITLSAHYTGDAYAHDAVYIADTGNHTIRRVRLTDSFEGCDGLLRVDTLAGGPREPGYADGTGAAARFNTPRGLATAPDGSIYVSDSGNHVIRRVTTDGVVSTVAGQPGVAGHRDGPALAAQLNTPSGLAINDAGELFIADTLNHCIRKLTPEGMLVTIAGIPGFGGYADGDASSARFAAPVGVALTPQGIVVADTSNNVIRRIEERPARRRAVQAAH